jgi:hypothetical protein
MHFLRQIVHSFSQAVKRRLCQWTKPDNHTMVLNTVLNLTRPKPELALENALLRQQLIVLNQSQCSTLEDREIAFLVGYDIILTTETSMELSLPIDKPPLLTQRTG